MRGRNDFPTGVQRGQALGLPAVGSSCYPSVTNRRPAAHGNHHLRHQELRHDEEGAHLARRARRGHDFHDYKAKGIDAATLDSWIGKVGWEVLLNKAGTTFKKLDETQKENLDAAKAKALMLEQPSMIKRPVLDVDGTLTVGFKPETYQQTFKA